MRNFFGIRKIKKRYHNCLSRTVLTSLKTVRPRKLFYHDAWMINKLRIADILEILYVREQERYIVLIRNMKAAIYVCMICSITSVKRVILFIFSRNEITIYLIYICRGSWFTNSSSVHKYRKLLECRHVLGNCQMQQV